jgi:hypothetical protein
MTAGIVKTNTKPLIAKAVYNYFKNSSSGDVFYASVGFPDRGSYLKYAGVDSDKTEFKGGFDANDYDVDDKSFYAQQTVSLHKVYSGGVSRTVPRVDWENGNTYVAWPDVTAHVLVKQFVSGVTRLNVYRCLFSPGTPSHNIPYSATTEPSKLPDGYVWKFLYSISNSEAIRFLTENWMPVAEAITGDEISTLSPGMSRYNQYLIQESAVKGTIYDYTGTLSAGVYTVTDLSVVPQQICQFQVLGDGTKVLVREGIGYVGPCVIKDSFGNDVNTAAAIISPGSGHGSDLPEEMGASNIIISARNVPDGDFLKIIKDSRYNMVTLIKNPIDASTGKYCAKDFYIACKGFSPAIGVGVNDSENVGGTKEIFITGVDEVNDIAYYVVTNQKQELASSIVVGDTVGTNTVTSVYEREVVFSSGQTLIVDWKAETATRSTDQVEIINFVLGFN